jgi:AraC-like DNA-binding protein
MCWFSLDGPLVEQFVTMLGIQAGVFHYGPPPVDMVHELMESLRDQSLEGRRRSSGLAIRELYEIVSRMPPPKFHSVVRQVRHLIQEGLADPELSAKGIATKLNYNRGSLSRMFHAQTGTTIMDCITQTRLEEAEMLLRQTEDRVGDIARKCGFSNVSYFTRWVKRHTGRLPHHLRDTTA